MIMKIKYSPSTGNFYPSSVAYRNLPNDLVEISQEDYDAAMSRPLGFTVSFANGKIVVHPPKE